MGVFIGCDLHARQQSVAMLDTTTGEVVSMTLEARRQRDVREFYSKLPRPVRVGIGSHGIDAVGCEPQWKSWESDA